MQQITAKLGTMRKAVEWVVYPRSSDAQGEQTSLIIQSDARIAQFDIKTGMGVLSAAKPNGAYFIHLNKFLGATEIVVPQDVIEAALAAQPKSGDEIGPGVRVV